MFYYIGNLLVSAAPHRCSVIQMLPEVQILYVYEPLSHIRSARTTEAVKCQVVQSTTVMHDDAHSKLWSSETRILPKRGELHS